MTKKWWKAAGVRAIKTVAQTAVATIGTSAAMGDVNWLMVGSASLLAGVLSALAGGCHPADAVARGVAWGTAAVGLPGSQVPGPDDIAAVQVDRSMPDDATPLT